MLHIHRSISISILVLIIASGFAASQPGTNSTAGSIQDSLRKWIASSGPLGWQFYTHVASAPSLTSISDACSRQLRQVIAALSGDEEWALKLVDAWGKLPAGVLYGHLMDMGQFDECIDIAQGSGAISLEGKYCLSTWPLTDSLNMQIAVCIPDRCSAGEMDVLLKEVLQLGNISFDATTMLLDEANCTRRRSEPFTVLEVVAACVLALLACLMVLSTGYDYYTTHIADAVPSPLLLAFSVRVNMCQLLRIASGRSSAPNMINCLNGIRCMSTIWIIFGHCYMWLLISPSLNSRDIVPWVASPFAMFLISGPISVDTFFFLSGLLLAMQALREMDRNDGKLNVLMMYVHRYLRLTPVVAIAVLIYMSLYRRLGNGPLWDNYMSATQLCEQTWWATLLYVQNYAAAGRMCLGHSWYLAVDMQLYFISPLVLIPVWRWRRKALAALLVVGLLLVACLFSVVIVEDFNVLDTTFKLGEDSMGIRKTYYATQTRASAWIIGIVFGYYLHTSNGKRITLSKTKVVLGWISSLALLFTCIFALYPYTAENAAAPSPVAGAFYTSLSRVAWPLGICWIVFACVNGYGGAANDFLSWSLWQPFSKLSYCMYVWHLLVENFNAGRIRSATHFSDYDGIRHFWSNFGITIFVALAMYLAVEAPMAVVDKCMFAKKTPTKRTDEQANDQPQPPTTISRQNLCE